MTNPLMIDKYLKISIRIDQPVNIQSVRAIVRRDEAFYREGPGYSELLFSGYFPELISYVLSYIFNMLLASSQISLSSDKVSFRSIIFCNEQSCSKY